MIEKKAKIYVAGHRGMVGSAIVRELNRQGYHNIITRTHKELDLLRQDDVERFFNEEKPEVAVLAAAKVGGIMANQSALADFMYDDMMLNSEINQTLSMIGKDVTLKIPDEYDSTKFNTVTGTVTEASFESGSGQIKIGDKYYSIENVVSIRQ